MNRVSKNLGSSICVAAIFMLASTAHSEEASVATGCSDGSKDKVINEISPKYAHNDFNGIGQDIVEASYTRSSCVGLHDIRWRLEATGSQVSEDAGNNYQGLVGVGFEIPLLHKLNETKSKSFDFTVTPIARLGYASFAHASDQVIAGAAVTMAVSGDLTDRIPVAANGGGSVPLLMYVASVRPEYTSYRSVSNTVIGADKSKASFDVVGDLGLDGALPGDWRWKTSVNYIRTDQDVPWNSIGSLVFGLRKTNAAHSADKWGVELWYRKGNGGYEGALLGIFYHWS